MGTNSGNQRKSSIGRNYRISVLWAGLQATGFARCPDHSFRGCSPCHRPVDMLPPLADSHQYDDRVRAGQYQARCPCAAREGTASPVYASGIHTLFLSRGRTPQNI